MKLLHVGMCLVPFLVRICIVCMHWLLHGASMLCVLSSVVQTLRVRSRVEELNCMQEMTGSRMVVELEQEEKERRKPTGVILMLDNLVNLL